MHPGIRLNEGSGKPFRMAGTAVHVPPRPLNGFSAHGCASNHPMTLNRPLYLLCGGDAHGSQYDRQVPWQSGRWAVAFGLREMRRYGRPARWRSAIKARCNPSNCRRIGCWVQGTSRGAVGVPVFACSRPSGCRCSLVRVDRASRDLRSRTAEDSDMPLGIDPSVSTPRYRPLGIGSPVTVFGGGRPIFGRWPTPEGHDR